MRLLDDCCNVAFISNLMESKVEFEAVDFPQANHLTIHIMAAIAEHEAKMISDRTRAALAAAKARGKRFEAPKFTDEDDVLLEELGVEVEAKKEAGWTAREERVIAGFEEIQRFVDQYGHAPRHEEDAISSNDYTPCASTACGNCPTAAPCLNPVDGRSPWVSCRCR
jgi:hypothetical protein